MPANSTGSGASNRGKNWSEADSIKLIDAYKTVTANPGGKARPIDQLKVNPSSWSCTKRHRRKDCTGIQCL